ncbi:adenylyl-sulfate kinase [Mucilaginibacter sp. dw_454]|uniref:adenylyl-sulfate kinase n=1 Tax=Mucilaginibacter sp. dw_454 TaxID=2720079 RepID=UPI001BD2B3A4|nr:adenylyl-sulfate kinase [Mucilaginibacter sp. dw_454]
MILQFCGLSGSGKTTIATAVQHLLQQHGITCEVVDGDIYRKSICANLGFSKADRNENIRRLAAVASVLSLDNIITIISAINPYEDVRHEIKARYSDVKTVYIECSLNVLLQRDTKKLYRRAMLPFNHPDRVNNLTGVNDIFEMPQNPDLILKTDQETIDVSAKKLFDFILSELK